jgi:hypothetical protein
MKNKIILVTPTYKRSGRVGYIKRMINYINEYNYAVIVQVIVEDDTYCNTDLYKIIKENAHYATIYIASGPTKDKGNVQRSLAYDLIEQSNSSGIIYNMDDDNGIGQGLFRILSGVSRLAIFPVHNLGPNGVEQPIVENNKIVGWDAGWLSRKYPVDMGGFAFHSDALHLIRKNYRLWDWSGIGGENEMIIKVLSAFNMSDNDIELPSLMLGKNDPYIVYHNLELKK